MKKQTDGLRMKRGREEKGSLFLIVGGLLDTKVHPG